MSNKAVNGSRSSGKLKELSEGELAKLAFFRNLKNLGFLTPGAFILYYITDLLGTIGQIMGWAAIIGYALFALEALLTFFTVVLSLLNPNKGWKIVQLAISAITALIYSFLAFIIYLGVKG